MTTSSSPRSLRWMAVALAAGLTVSACGSSDGASPAQQSAEDAPPEVSVEPDGGDATDQATTTAPSAGETALEPSAASSEPPQPADADVVDPLFFGDFTTLDGTVVDLADFAGTDVVLWFWAPW